MPGYEYGSPAKKSKPRKQSTRGFLDFLMGKKEMEKAAKAVKPKPKPGAYQTSSDPNYLKKAIAEQMRRKKKMEEAMSK